MPLALRPCPPAIDPVSAPSDQGAPGAAALRAWPRAALALTLVAALAACSDKPAGKAEAPRGPATVGVVVLKAESRTLSTELPGRTQAFLSAEIRPQIGGIVQKRLFTEGALVKAGQALYQIDPASYEVAQASARAALAKAEAVARTAEVNARRNAELVEIDAISRQVHDESQALVKQTASDVAAAKAALANAGINLGYTRIVAPIAGRTSLSTVTPGALVTANQTTVLTTLQQIDPIYVDVTQSAGELLKLKRDLAAGRFERTGANEARVRIKLDDGTLYPKPGRLQFSGVQVNPSTGAVTLRAVVPNPDGILMPGMYVRAELETGVAAQSLLIPQQAVTRDLRGLASALVVNKDNKVERRALEVGEAVGNRWDVKSGLAVGERLVVDGLQRVKVGDTVKVQEVSLQRPGRSANGQGGQGAGEGKGGNAPQADPATSAAPASTAAAASATR